MTLRYILYRLINFYEVIIFVQCILSWFPRRGVVEDVFEALSALVDPFVNLFRRFIPPIGGVDWTPMVAILVLQLVQRIIL